VCTKENGAPAWAAEEKMRGQPSDYYDHTERSRPNEVQRIAENRTPLFEGDDIPSGFRELLPGDEISEDTIVCVKGSWFKVSNHSVGQKWEMGFWPMASGRRVKIR
jgi:hypothetical protein